MRKISAQKSKKKKLQYKKKSKALTKAIKRGLSVFFLFFVSFLGITGFLFYKKLNQNFASAFSSDSSDFVSQDLTSVLYLEVSELKSDTPILQEISFYIFDKSTFKAVKYEIPIDTLIDIPGKFGEETLNKSYALGMLESNGDWQGGVNLTIKSLQKIFAFPVDRYILADSEYGVLFNNIFEGNLPISKINADVYMVKDNFKTNFNLAEFFNIYSFINKLTKDRIIIKSFTDVYMKNNSLLDEELMDLTFDSDLSREAKSIAVLNGTQTTGMALFGSRLVKNYGGRVVAVGNTHELYKNSVIIADATDSLSVFILKNIFNIDEVILKTGAREFEENEINRSDITIILGLDFENRL